MSNEVLIPEGNCCCPAHIRNGYLSEESFAKIQTTDLTYMNRSDILDLLTRVRQYALNSDAKRIDFDGKTLRDEDYINLTGLHCSEFDSLCEHIQDSVRNTPARTMRMSLGIFLMKLKSGLPNKVLSTVFNITKSSIRRAISSVTKALYTHFVPEYLGLQHISRKDVNKDHTRPLAQSLLGNNTGNQPILVLDGTYIYIQKSNNFSFQRRSYSMHKGRPLVKLIVVVTTDGYFLTICGRYFVDAKNNDASILKHMLKSNIEDIKAWVEKDDVFVVDRGFRDSIEALEELGIQAEMPHFMKKGEKQMTTEDANDSRLVTKIRWVVESANARIKQWRYLDNVLPTNQIPHIGEYVCIVCAISNKFSPPLSTGNSLEDEQLACKMVYLSKQINELKQYVEINKLERRTAKWTNADEIALEEFPVLDEDQLKFITCGTYQLKLSSSYMQEHLDGDCEIQVHKDEDRLLRVRLRSRHVSSRSYPMWIRYTESNIVAGYCKCPAGSRVVGACSHLASIMWFRGFARHQNLSSYGVRNWGANVCDAAAVVEPIDASDSDNDDEDDATTDVTENVQ